MLGLVLVFLAVGITIGHYGGSPFATAKYMIKWLAAKFLYDFVQIIMTNIFQRYTDYLHMRTRT